MSALLAINGITAISTLRLRKNGNNANQAFTIAGSTTGNFEDNTNTDTIANGDEMDYQIVTGATGTGFNFGSLSLIFEPTTTTISVTKHAYNTIPAFTTASATRYFPIVGNGVAGSTTEAQTQLKMKKAGTIKYLDVRVTANARNQTTTVRSRKNTANGALSIAIGNAQTGEFEDTVNSDTIAVDDLVNYQFVTGTGTQSLTIQQIGVSIENSARITPLIAGHWGNTISAAVTWGIHIGGALTYAGTPATESPSEISFGSGATVSNLLVKVITNGSNSTSTARIVKNGSNTSMTVAVGSAATGNFEDNTNTFTIVDGDKLYYTHATAGTGTIVITYFVCYATVYAQVTKQLTMKYDVRSEVTKQLTTKYDVRSEVTKQLSLLYNVIKEVIKQLTARYDILTQVTKTNTLLFNILTPVERRLDLNYVIGDDSTLIRLIKRDTVETAPPWTPDPYYLSKNAGTDDSIIIHNQMGSPTWAEWVSESGAFTKLNWEDGEWVVYLRVISVSANDFYLSNVDLERIGNDMSSPNFKENADIIPDFGEYLQAGKTYVIKIGTSTGLFNDPLINPEANDRVYLFLEFNTTNISTDQTIEIGVNLGNDNDEVITPLVGALSVTKTLTAKYNILAETTKQLTARYDIRNEVTKQLTARYDIIAEVTKTNTLLYNVIQEVTKSNSIKFNINQEVTKATTLLFNVNVPIEKQLTILYNILNEVTKSTTVRYDVIAQVTKVLNLLYTINSTVEKISILKYSIDQEVIKTNTFIYNINNTITKTNTLIYNILQDVTKQTTLKYDIIAEVTKTLNLLYDVDSALGVVVKSLSLKYNIDAQVTKETTLKYNITVPIEKTTTLRYDIMKEVEKSNTLIYNIDAQVTKVLTLLHNIDAQVIKTNTIRYDINTFVIKTNTILYNILNEVEKSTTLRYDIRSEVEKTNTILYDVAGAIGVVIKSLTLAYNINEEVTKSTTIKYNINNTVTKVLTLLHNILQETTKQLTTRYDIREEVTDAKIIRYDINQEVTKNLTIRYDVLKEVTKQLTTRYDILQEALKTLTLRYAIIQQVTKSTSINYNINNIVEKTNTIRYNINNLVETDVTLRYDIRAEVEKDVDIVYDIISQVTKTTTLQYNILNEITKTHTLLYDVMNSVEASTTLRYDILQETTKLLQLRYNILKSIEKTTSIIYNILPVTAVEHATMHEQLLDYVYSQFSIVNPAKTSISWHEWYNGISDITIDSTFVSLTPIDKRSTIIYKEKSYQCAIHIWYRDYNDELSGQNTPIELGNAIREISSILNRSRYNLYNEMKEKVYEMRIRDERFIPDEYSKGSDGKVLHYRYIIEMIYQKLINI